MSKLTFQKMQSLIPDMEAKGVEKEHFSFAYAKQTIDCILAFTKSGYELLVGVHALNFGFVVPIVQNKNKDYIVELTDEDYLRFCKALKLSYRNDGFTSNTLLKLLSNKIPEKSSGIKINYETMINYVECRKIDESEKIYFKGWNDHIKDGKKAQNFDKTEFYLGKQVTDYCRRNNISSMWTDIQFERKEYQNPF